MPLYQVGIKRKFVARHYLVGDFGDESRPHEHVYTAEWICSAEGLDTSGFAVDISIMESALEQVLKGISGRLLNELEFFQGWKPGEEPGCQSGCQPSVENVARFILTELFGLLERLRYDTSMITEAEVRIWESETAWASYRMSLRLP